MFGRLFKGTERSLNQSIRKTSVDALGKSMRSKGPGSVNVYTKNTARSIKDKSIPMARSAKQASIFESFNTLSNINIGRRNIKQLAHATVSHPKMLKAQAVVGFAAMTSVAVVNGAMGRAEDIMATRYMRDSRYSSRLLAQTNVGNAMGNSRLSIGNHTGLSLAMHAGRHG